MGRRGAWVVGFALGLAACAPPTVDDDRPSGDAAPADRGLPSDAAEAVDTAGDAAVDGAPDDSEPHDSAPLDLDAARAGELDAAPEAGLDAAPDAAPDARPYTPAVCADAGPPGVLPDLGPADESPFAPLPPIVGATLGVDGAGTRLLWSDVIRRAVRLFDAVDGAHLARLTLPGAHLGRLLFTADGERGFVVLRDEGAILVVDARDDRLEARARWPACGDPQGLAYDPGSGRLHVVCRGGQYIVFAADGSVVRRVHVDADLRDVALRPDGEVWITRFRAAELLVVAADGAVEARYALRPPVDWPCPRAAGTAWRMRPAADGGVVIAYSLRMTGPLPRIGAERYPDGYTQPWISAVQAEDDERCALGAAITAVVEIERGPDGALRGAPMIVPAVGLPTDVAKARGAIFVTDAAVLWSWSLLSFERNRRSRACFEISQVTGVAVDAVGRVYAVGRLSGDVCAISGAWSGEVASWQPEVERLFSHELTGHALFHGEFDDDVGLRRGGLACATCHPEGLDDGHVWHFPDVGPRRTLPLVGGVSDSAPFDWGGERPDLRGLIDDFVERRQGRAFPLRDYALARLVRWLDTRPVVRPTPLVDPAVVAAGRALFVERGCDRCHGGARLSDGASHDVGTGGCFQTPTLLGVGTRAPLMHDGCAPRLAALFDPDLRRADGTVCGGGRWHDGVDGLGPGEVAALVDYLRTL